MDMFMPVSYAEYRCMKKQIKELKEENQKLKEELDDLQARKQQESEETIQKS